MRWAALRNEPWSATGSRDTPNALSLAKAISMGLKSGLKGGRSEGMEKRPVDGLPRTMQRRSYRLDQFSHSGPFMAREVVHDDHVARL